MTRLLRLALVAAVGCGPAASSPVVTLVPTSHERLDVSIIQSLQLFVVDQKSKSGATLTCARFAGVPFALREDLGDVTVLATAVAATGALRLDGLAPRGGLLLVADAYATSDGSGTVVATGCTDGVTVHPGIETTVTLRVSSLSP